LEVRRRNFEVADANYRTAEKAVEDTYLRAPFDGQVARKLVEDFVNVQAQQVILILQDDSSLEVVVNVPEGDALRGAQYLMNANEMAILNPAVEIGSLPDRQFPARLKEFATTADPVTRTFAVTFFFESPDDATLRPGMTARLTLSPETQLLTGRSSLPASAVLADEQGAAYVWRIERSDMTVSRATIEVGAVFGDEIELLGGLSPGDLIAVSGVHNLRAGMQVRSLDPSD
jgi:RND family efflux transporter MFP subunit